VPLFSTIILVFLGINKFNTILQTIR